MTDPSSPVMDEVIMLDHYIMFFGSIILTIVWMALWKVIKNKIVDKSILFNEMIELFWTSSPAMFLLLICIPSLALLYSMDDIVSPLLTVKAIGHQWYWSYEYPDYPGLSFDSSMVPYDNYSIYDQFRLYDVDHRLVMPSGVGTRMMTTSSDVIHSWTVPSMGVKMDASPGRMNQFWMQSMLVGNYYGQCSEVCGVMHSFMPVCVEVTDIWGFKHWVEAYMPVVDVDQS